MEIVSQKFTSLPNDVLGAIAGELDFGSCTKLQFTCRSLYRNPAISNVRRQLGKVLVDEGRLRRPPSPEHLAMGNYAKGFSTFCSISGVIGCAASTLGFSCVVSVLSPATNAVVAPILGAVAGISTCGIINAIIWGGVHNECILSASSPYNNDMRLAKLLDDPNYGSINQRNLSEDDYP